MLDFAVQIIYNKLKGVKNCLMAIFQSIKPAGGTAKSDEVITMEWQKFKTTRLYLHPPKAERIITLWREGKIMLGEVETPINKPYGDFSAAGIWFIGEDGNPASFKESSYELRGDGIPVHKLHSTMGKISVTFECVCDYVRCPSAYIRATVKSADGAPVSTKFGFILRQGKEEDLIFSAPDVYAIYDPQIDDWRKLPASFVYDGYLRVGDYFLKTEGDSAFAYDEMTGEAYAEIELKGDESRTFTFVLGKGECVKDSFDSVKERSVSLWEKELSRINKLPEAVISDNKHLTEIKNLTVQLLQCFCYGVGKDLLYSRQGGLQRGVWTYEAMPVLTALNRIGDFEDYIEPVIDVYFNEFYEESGEIVPLGIHWAMATGTILNSFGSYAVSRGKEYYLRYRDKALRCFEWIKETRGSRAYDGAVSQSSKHGLSGKTDYIDGLFPPMSCCDDPLIFQSWLTTDCNNVMGLREFSRAARLFDDEKSEEISAEYEDYKRVISDAWETVKANAEAPDELEVPYTPSGNNEEVAKRFAFSPAIGFLVDALDMEPCDYERIINYYTRRGQMRGGLYEKMPNKDPNIPGVVISKIASVGFGYIWYVCAQEYGWFNCLYRHGDMERCSEIIRDAEKYAMSDEYYMLERYHQGDPWYAPWSPNASCSGRLINMILDLYG